MSGYPCGVLLLLLVVACVSESACDDCDATSGDTSDSGGETFACPDPGPAPELSDWTLTGTAPTTGFATLATSGEYPIYLGSTLSGIWYLAAPDQPEWVAGNSLPTTHTVGDLVVSPNDSARMYRSAGGRVARTDDGALSWRQLPFGERGTGSAFDGHTYGIAVPWGEPETVYAVLDTGVFGVSYDLGETWEARGRIDIDGPDPTRLDYFGRIRIAAGASGTDPILVHDGAYIWRSSDEGASWSAVAENAGNPDALVRDPSNFDVVLAPGGLISVDAGANWEESTLGNVERAFWGEQLWVFADGTLTVGDGVEQAARSSPAAELSALAEIGDDVWAADSNHVWHSADGGLRWSEYTGSLFEKNFVVVRPHPVCPGVVWAGTRCDGGVYRSANWGQNWEHVDIDGHYVMDVVFDPSDPATIWLVNDDELLVSRDDGATWSVVWQAYHFHGIDFDPEQAGRMLLGSVGSGNYADTSGNIYLSEDYGATWAMTTGIPQNASSAHAFRYLGGGIVLAGFYLGGGEGHPNGQGIGLFRSVDSGKTWVDTMFPHSDVATIAYTGAIVWVAAGDGVYRSDDQGISWEKVLEGRSFWVDFEGATGFAVFENSEVYRTEDGGNTWAQSHIFEADILLNTLERIEIAPGREMVWWTRYNRGIYGLSL